MRSKLRLFGVALVCAKLFFVPVIFDRTSDVPFSVIKALSSHGHAYVLAAVMLGLFIQFRGTLIVRSHIHVAVLAFLAANVAATPFATDTALALYGVHERMTGLATIADGVLLYFAIAFLVRTATEARVLAASFFAGAAVVLIYALVQFLGLDPWTWAVDGAQRPFSTIGQANNLALYLSVVSVGAAAVALFGPALPVVSRVGLACFAAAALASMITTQTRSGLLGVMSGSGVLVALTWTLHPHRRARPLTLAGVVGGSAALALILFLTPLGTRFLSTVDFSPTAEGDAAPRLEGAADVRAALYRIALDMVRERPILGYGPDNFLPDLPRFRSDHEPFEVQESQNTSAHSWVAQVAVTSGIIGLIAFVAIAATAVVVTFSRGFRPAAWVALGMLAAFLGAGVTTVNAIATDWLFWGAVGVVAAATSRSPNIPSQVDASVPRKRTKPPLTARRQGRAPVTAWVLVAIAALLALTTTTALDASRAAKASQAARLAGRNQEAISLGLLATRQDGLRPHYWDTLGLAYVSADRYRDAVPAFENANRLASYDFRYDGNLARTLAVLVQRGETSLAARAREVADRIVRKDPNNPLANLARATVMQVLGDLPEALKSIERAIALDRTANREMYVTGTQVLTALGRAPDGIALARRGVSLMRDQLSTVPIRVELARALAASGQFTDALREVDAALAIQPEHTGARRLRAQIEAASGR